MLTVRIRSAKVQPVNGASSLVICISLAEPSAAPDAGETTAPTVQSACEDLYARGDHVASARACEAEGALEKASVARWAAGHEALALERLRRHVAEGATEEALARLAEWTRRARLVEYRVEADADAEARTLELRRDGAVEDAMTLAWPAGTTQVVLGLDPGPWTLVLRGGVHLAAEEKVSVQREGSRAHRLATRAQTGLVRLQLGPRRAQRRGFQVAWQGPRRMSAVQGIRDAELPVVLPVGVWTATVSAPGHSARSETFMVATGEQSRAVTLTRDPAAQRAARTALGIGIAGGGLLIAGVAVTTWGASQLQLLDCGESDDPCDISALEAYKRDTAIGRIGVSLLGAGLGAVVPAVIARVGSPKRAVLGEAIAGSLLFGGGLAWGIAERDIDDNGQRMSDVHRSRVAMSLFGAGLAIITGTVVDVLVRKRAEKQATRHARMRSAAKDRRVATP